MEKEKINSLSKEQTSIDSDFTFTRELSFSNINSCSKTKEAVKQVHKPGLFEVFRLLMRR